MTDISHRILSILQGFNKTIARRFPDDAQEAQEMLLYAHGLIEASKTTFPCFPLYARNLQYAISRGDIDAVVLGARKIASAQERYRDFDGREPDYAAFK